MLLSHITFRTFYLITHAIMVNIQADKSTHSQYFIQVFPIIIVTALCISVISMVCSVRHRNENILSDNDSHKARFW
jgi:hypothetical protein